MSDAVIEEPQVEEVKPKRTYRRRSTKAAQESVETPVEATATPAASQAENETQSEVKETKKPRATRTRRASTKAATTKTAAKTKAAKKTTEASEEASAAESTKATAETAEGAAPQKAKTVSNAAAEGAPLQAEMFAPAASALEGATQESAEAQAPKGAAHDSQDQAQAQGQDQAQAQAEHASQDQGDTETTSDASSPDSDTRSNEERSYQSNRKDQRKGRSHTKNNSHQKNSSQQKSSHFRSRRSHQQNRREPMVPQTSKEDLAKLKVAELRAKADELEVEHKGLKKAELVEAVFAASIKAEGFMETAGILDILADGYGFLRTNGYLPSENDVYVGTATIRRNGLRKGDYVTGQTRPARPNEKYAALQRVDTVNGIALEDLGKRVRFSDLTPVFPDERLVLEHGRSTITARVIDLCAPIGKGQRGLIVSPPKAGKTTILKDIAAAIAANNPEVHLMCLLVDERPEEVTDMERSIKGEVISSTFDMPSENHIAVSELVIERAKRLVENGEDVVILLDSLTRLARAYNLAQPASGRILSGGVDSTALYPPKKFLGAARNIEGGGSLTILASALIETGSKMDEVIFEEFKGTGNMEVKLDRQLADRRIFPAIDPVASGTRREDLLLDPQEAPLIWAVRRILANRNNTERATESLVKSLQQTKNNQEFLVRAAKKAQGHHFEEGVIEF